MITIVPVQLSVAVTKVISGGGTVPLQAITGGAGQVITGGVLSKHISVWKGAMKSFKSAVLSAEDYIRSVSLRSCSSRLREKQAPS